MRGDSPGGFVMDSRSGLYDSVLVLDYKSLYPSIIRTFLIDPVGLVEGLRLQGETALAVGGRQFRGQHRDVHQQRVQAVAKVVQAARDLAAVDQHRGVGAGAGAAAGQREVAGDGIARLGTGRRRRGSSRATCPTRPPICARPSIASSAASTSPRPAR